MIKDSLFRKISLRKIMRYVFSNGIKLSCYLKNRNKNFLLLLVQGKVSILLKVSIYTRKTGRKFGKCTVVLSSSALFAMIGELEPAVDNDWESHADWWPNPGTGSGISESCPHTLKFSNQSFLLEKLRFKKGLGRSKSKNHYLEQLFL